MRQNKKPFLIYFLPSEKEKLEKAAKANGVTQTQYARDVLNKHLNKLK